MTMHAQSSISLKDANAKKRELQKLIADALNNFYEQTGLFVDSVSVQAVESYGLDSISIKHIVSVEVKL